MSLAAVPAYLWARSLVSRSWALAAAALAVAVPGLTYSGLVMTEVLFYPLLVLAAWAAAEAIARPSWLNARDCSSRPCSRRRRRGSRQSSSCPCS